MLGLHVLADNAISDKSSTAIAAAIRASRALLRKLHLDGVAKLVG